MTKLTAPLLACLALLAAAAAPAAEPAPAVSTLPVPPDATPVVELSLSDADLLPAIKESLPTVVAALPNILGLPEGVLIEPAEAETIFRDVQSVEAMAAIVPPEKEPGAAARAIAEFYEQEMGKQGWRRLFWMQPPQAAGVKILLMSPKLDQGLFGLVVGAEGRELMVVAVRLRGSVNIAPLIGRAVMWWSKRSAPAPPPAPGG
jgi:hypothetical protein